MFFLTPTEAFCHYLLASSEESWFKCCIWISWYRPLCNRFLDDTILGALSSHIPLPKFWCKHMPPNFGIKVILFQNFHACASDRFISWVENLDLGSTFCHHLCQPMSPCFKTLREHHCFMGVWIHLSRPTIKCLSDSSESNSTTQLCFSSACFLECPWLC